MKLAAIYTVYNGLELLNGSIAQIQDSVDEIIIVFQSTSNGGEYSDKVKYCMSALSRNNKKVTIVYFMPDLSLNTKQNELNKHNLGLKTVREMGCTHWFLSATDHYYRPEEVEKVKTYVKMFNPDVTLTSMYTYYKNPTWQITPIEDYYMPFICKIHPETVYHKNQWIHRVDPSVRVNTFREMVVFPPEDIMMHHYSMIREDIENKFNNAAASSRWGDKAKIYLDEYNAATIESKLEYFGGRGLKVVPNYFNI